MQDLFEQLLTLPVPFPVETFHLFSRLLHERMEMLSAVWHNKNKQLINGDDLLPLLVELVPPYSFEKYNQLLGIIRLMEEYSSGTDRLAYYFITLQLAVQVRKESLEGKVSELTEEEKQRIFPVVEEIKSFETVMTKEIIYSVKHACETYQANLEEMIKKALRSFFVISHREQINEVIREYCLVGELLDYFKTNASFEKQLSDFYIAFSERSLVRKEYGYPTKQFISTVQKELSTFMPCLAQTLHPTV